MKHASTSVRVMNPRIIDLFAGPGGLDVAAHWLGVPVTGIEWDPNACATRRAAGLDTREGDVREFGPHLFPDANVLAGGPPCQTYTVAGTGAGRMALERVLRLVKSMSAGEDVQDHIASFDDERTGLVLEPLRWALGAYRDGRPYEAVVLEQVPAVLPVWEAMGEALEGLGYTVAVGVLRTEEFGVPQTRRRAILLARYGSDVRLPAATHRSYRKGAVREQDCSDLLPWNTMGDALSSTRGYEFSVVSNYGTGGDPRARGRRSSDEPAFTVTGKVSRNRLIGGDGAEINRFTMAEAGRLQTFPMNFPWSGSDISQQIGNAIPPRLGAHILAAALGMSDVINESFLREVMDGNWFESLIHRDAGEGKDGSVFLEHV
ncbi:DNA cytosine methyltransferase [Rhodococcus rhodochrous]|uniref:DNA cytosine methyltransferase n=1 Tax=Rhodococcus rhodochrous TaxID=1829 RepID=UPI0027DEF2D6|nr:DNA cytosine methyltransferase [Rhodococcus rhodochrous]